MHTRNFSAIAVALLAMVPLFFLGWLFDKEFAPRGIWEARTGFEKPSSVIQPSGLFRMKREGKRSVLSTESDTVQFRAENRHTFKTARVTATWRSGAGTVEAGVLARQDPPVAKTKVLYHSALEALKWFKTESDAGEILWQKTPRFSSVEDFYRASVPADRVLTVNADYAPPLILPLYFPQKIARRYEISLRGPQTILFYSGGETMTWKFSAQDMNRHDGADEILLRISDPSGKTVAEKRYEDDGEIWGSGKAEKLRDVEWSGDLEAGVYRLQIAAGDDIFLRRIETSAQKFVFQYVVYLGDTVGFSAGTAPVTFYGRTKGFSLRTPHPEGIQSVGVDGKLVEIREPNTSYQTVTTRAISEIVVGRPDLKIDFDGFLALTPDAFFIPKAIGFSDQESASQWGAEYILAKNYHPFFDGEWIRGSADLSLDGVERGDGVTFILDRRGDAASGEWLIDDLRVTLERPPLDLPRLSEALLARFESWRTHLWP